MASKRRQKRVEERRTQVKRVSEKCRVCGKSYGTSETDAWAMAKRQFDRWGGEMPKRVYECTPGSGRWHWTRQAVYLPAQEPAHYTAEYWVD